MGILNDENSSIRIHHYSQRHGSPGPDPLQNVMDPQHCYLDASGHVKKIVVFKSKKVIDWYLDLLIRSRGWSRSRNSDLRLAGVGAETKRNILGIGTTQSKLCRFMIES